MDAQAGLRRHVLDLLDGGQAHATFEDAFRALPARLSGQKGDGIPYSIWELLEHLRITQNDILEYSKDTSHQSPDWPSGYWPKESAPRDEKQWDESLQSFQSELAEMKAIVAEPTNDLLAELPNQSGHTLLREALLLADHNSYHLGQVVALRKLLGVWHAP